MNNCDAVPTIPPTVTSSQTLPGLSASLFSGVAQRIVVVVLQLAVGQIAALIPAVSVCCPVPKLRPVKLTTVPPLLAQLKDEPTLDTTGASKVKIGSDVPVIPSTLATRMPGVLPSGKNPAQFAKVVDVHETVEQPPPCNTADIVGSFTSKLIGSRAAQGHKRQAQFYVSLPQAHAHSPFFWRISRPPAFSSLRARQPFTR